MPPDEKKIQIFDVLVILILFFIACILGKNSMNRFGDTWIAFNGPALGILAVGEFLWWRVRKRLVLKNEEK